MKKLFTLITALVFSASTFAQTEATTKDGKKVILNSDGTWKEMPAIKDTTLSNKCSDYIDTKEDKMTGDFTTSIKNTLIVSDDGGKTGLGIFMMVLKKEFIVLNIKAVGSGGCVDEKTKINILFTDNTRMELFGDNKFNCEGKATVYFGGFYGKKKDLEQLKTKKIQTMRVWTSKSYVEKDFTDENSHAFFTAINCLSNLTK